MDKELDFYNSHYNCFYHTFTKIAKHVRKKNISQFQAGFEHGTNGLTSDKHY